MYKHTKFLMWLRNPKTKRFTKPIYSFICGFCKIIDGLITMSTLGIYHSTIEVKFALFHTELMWSLTDEEYEKINR